MNKDIRAYLRLEATVAAAFNFFINGMIAALIYHKVDWVSTDILSLTIDLTLTCFLATVISVFFCRASLRRIKAEGILEPKNKLFRRLGRMARHPVLMALSMSFAIMMALFALVVSVVALLKLSLIAFSVYMVIKPMFGALLGASVTLVVLYAGMNKA